MSSEKLINLSFNPKLVDKAKHTDKAWFREGFQAFEATLDELEETIKLGIAFSYQYRDEKRSAKNFVASDFLAVDFDGGLTISDCLALDLVQNHASLIYTTASHTQANHRFRLVFVLPRTIEDPQELRFAVRALTERLGGDPSATDPARIFFGSKGGWSKQLGSTLSSELLDELILDGRLEVASDSRARTFPVPNRSLAKIKPEQTIVLSDGTTATFGNIAGHKQVHCPFHVDYHPSAFVSGKRDGRYLHCSTCQKTWHSSASRPRRYNFHDFDDFIKAIKSGAFYKGDNELVALERFMEPHGIKPHNISLQDGTYFEGPDMRLESITNGVTFIKSPKGSGKTTFLENLLKPAPDALETEINFADGALQPDPKQEDPSKKVLLIGHRQALIGELCERLGLNCYLDYPESLGANVKAEKKRSYGVCLDSLWRVDQMRYDIVVIDEVEQVLGHFLSSTVGAARNRLFEVFFRLIRMAKHVIVLDADLGWTSFNTIRMLKSLSLEEGQGPEAKEPEWPIQIVLNERKDANRKLHMYESQPHLVAKLKQDILAGKRVFVTSNSKKTVDAIAKTVEALAKQANVDIPHLSITSANSKTESVQGFITNIRDRILDYGVILSSPSLGTGVDISFPNETQEIDCVFGLFEARITNHFEIDQQLARVRNPREVYVWISPQCFNFETEFEVVVDDLLRTELATGIRYGFRWRDRKSIADEDPFLTMAAQTTVKNRASKNNLKANFIRHKLDQGWDIGIVDKDDSLAQDGKQLLKDGRLRSKAEEIKKVTSATVLNHVAFEKLKRRLNFQDSPITESERYDLKRTSFELFYRADASPEMLELDISKTYRLKVLLFEALAQASKGGTEFKKKLPTDKQDDVQRTHVKVIPDRQVGAALLHLILETTPFYQNGQFNPSVTYSHGDLEAFVDLSLHFKKFVEGQFDLNLRKDFKTKPMQHMQQVLNLVGLRQEYICSTKVGSQKIRHYTLDRSALRRMQSIVDARAETAPWPSLDARHGFEYSEEDYDWLYTYT
ncbi:hypothetical protein FTO60_04265 [Octadecabacter sp. SW4]|uniref:plasmid replication protein, CyRepA1 family n=1 Tax=Octadecabacter sp. SW4 TaxID=2602067 RepID=UPI0011C1DFD9|nr:plasmid replication protein, CyRepA1 family [Octadecabacter sp. SW4]QEE34995.1 hypothetical protein FTO60_04265 [Octadecabacter sp. SW4]